MKMNKLKKWWYNINTIFCFHIEFSLVNFYFAINLLFIDLKFKSHSIYLNLFEIDNYIFGRWRHLTKHKNVELEIYFNGNLKTGINILQNIHTDHAGLWLEIYILGLTIDFHLLDGRHWDWENNKWE